jgi:two-component system response regulator YesN
MYKVLLAEDEMLILEGIRSIIEWEKLGLEVVHMARNGMEAVTMLEKEPVDIIVTDINMPLLDGIELLTKVRSKDERTRCIILSGYDEFEYARKAIRLEVENYILKPINEEELEAVLKEAVQKLIKIDEHEKNGICAKQKLLRFLSGEMKEQSEAYFQEIGLAMNKAFGVAANIKVKQKDKKDEKMADIVAYLKEDCKQLDLNTFYYAKDEIVLLLFTNSGNEDHILSCISAIQVKIEMIFEVQTFISVSSAFTALDQVSHAFEETKNLQKYLMFAGYSTCINKSYVSTRKSKEITLDEATLQKMILTKDHKAVNAYIEDLFIHNSQIDQVTSDAIYNLSIKLALVLQNIINEFKLSNGYELKDLTDVVKELFETDELSDIKAIFVLEIMKIMECIHVEDSQYTPVVRQILSEVEKNYREDMNLKTLAHKYHMNTSYLGQIFQKEVGYSFSQYLTNIKNSKAKELIMNTNMRINDIATEVGYPDASYFFRKFKQCYGTSPATLREMKQY